MKENMKLLKLQLTDLFGVFNHSIKCNQDERITILTAPNGYGKTISLKIIHSFFNKKFIFFDKLPFKKIVLSFDDKKNIEISKSNNDVKFSLKENGKQVHQWLYKKDMLNKISTRDLDRYLPNYIGRVGLDKWMDESENKILSTSEVIERFSDKLPKKYTNIPESIESIINALDVYLIQEQRLIIRQSNHKHRFIQSDMITDAIQKHANELSRQIENATTAYAQKTQSLDSSFPKRLFENDIDAEDLSDRLTKLEEKQTKISKFGLLKLEENPFLKKQQIKDKDKKILSLYILDSENKLAVFDSLVNRIELFTTILNERRFTSKSIEIDREYGFIFKTKGGGELKSTELSSGEQHEVVLLFELIFNTKENSLVLIDEPEISLHVVWQKAFLDDIKEIIKLQKIDIIIATHSPQIINENWDLTVNLND